MASVKFKPGESGNPRGRPPNKTATALLRKAIVDAMPEIIQGLIDAAKQGDVGAATVLLSRCVPVLKAESLPVNLPVVDGLAEQGGVIIRSIMSGKTAPDVGAALITALASQSKIVEIDDLIKRIEILEGLR
jgi:hypothetical protein